MTADKPVLALYDIRSKQDYIYRTNRIKEISGGSALLADLFTDFFHENPDFKFRTDWRFVETPDDFLDAFAQSGYDAEFIYEGGGNLCVIYQNRETYLRANRLLSRKVLEDTYSVSILAACTEVTGDFSADRQKLYAENARRKNLGAYHVPCNVLPFTLVDRLTYQPVVKKTLHHQYTTERMKKQEKYEKDIAPLFLDENHVLELDSMTDKGKDSILAIIYIDGNNMGAKVKAATEDHGVPVTDYAEGIRRLRAFSKKTNQDFVERPLDAIQRTLLEKYYAAKENQRQYYKYRTVISGGDEITLICNAHAVPLILQTYFETLTEASDNSACAGVALFHSHAPFADVYEIAEQCCESGKKQSHLAENEGKNYIDFHFCHAGITNDLATIRETQEGKYSAKPYEFASTWKQFRELGKAISAANRSDVKSLCEAMIQGDSYYRETLRMIQSRGKLSEIDESDLTVKRMIFDIASVFDFWFSGEEAAIG